MKRRLTIVLLLSLLAVAAVAVVCWWPRLFPSAEVSDLYRRYEHADGIRASFLKDYPVNDTLRLDVTLLEATTDTGWDTLKVHFGIAELPDDLRSKIEGGEDIVTVRRIHKGLPMLPMDTVHYDNNEVCAISRQLKIISIYHTKNETENVIVTNYKLWFNYKDK